MLGKSFASIHFNLKELADGVFAAIATEGGLAASNAALIDLGEETLVLDSFESLEAGRDLRMAAEGFFDRPVSWLIMSHPHDDHWNGNAAFDDSTTILSTRPVLEAMQQTAREWEEEKENPGEYHTWRKQLEAQLRTEKDPRWRAGLERSLRLCEHVLATLPDFNLRLPDETFSGDQIFQGTRRRVELYNIGSVHSQDDSYLVLPDDDIVFLADIGFFHQQPFLAFCDLEAWHKQISIHLAGDYEIFVPGHGDPGGKTELAQQRDYMDVMDQLVRRALAREGEAAARSIVPPSPYDSWLMGGMSRLEANIDFLIKYHADRGTSS